MRRTFSCLVAAAVLAAPLPVRAVVPQGAPAMNGDGIVDASSNRKKASKAALVAGGVGGALLLGAVIANANRPQPQVVVVQPPPVIVQQPPPQAAQPQALPPNCQPVVQTIHIQGVPQPQQAVSIACRQPDGSWQYR
jgi:hypothetical protein